MIMFPGQPTDIREVRAAPGRECVPLNLPATTATTATTLHFGAPAPHTIAILHLETSRIENSISETKITNFGSFHLKMHSSNYQSTCCRVMGTGAPCHRGEVEPKILLA